MPGYGIDYWPKDADIIQVDINSDRIGLTKKISVGICGDAKLVAKQILDNWDEFLPKFVKVMPVDYRRALIEIEKQKLELVN